MWARKLCLTPSPLLEAVRYMMLRCKVLTSGYIAIGADHLQYMSWQNYHDKKIAYSLRIQAGRCAASFGDQTLKENSPNFSSMTTFSTHVQTIEPVDSRGRVRPPDAQAPPVRHRGRGMVHNGGGKRKGSIAVCWSRGTPISKSSLNCALSARRRPKTCSTPSGS